MNSNKLHSIFYLSDLTIKLYDTDDNDIICLSNESDMKYDIDFVVNDLLPDLHYHNTLHMHPMSAKIVKKLTVHERTELKQFIERLVSNELTVNFGNYELRDNYIAEFYRNEIGLTTKLNKIA